MDSEQKAILSKLPNLTHSTPPKDKFHIVFFIFLLQGVGVLFPWNAFISAPDYFSALYGENTMLYFSVAYSIPNLLGVLAMVKLSPKIPMAWKMYPSFILTLLVLILVPILGFSGVNGIRGFIVTILLIVLSALSTAVLQGNIFGMAGALPPNYITAVMSGNGVAGVACSFLRIVTKLTIEQNRKHVPLLIMTTSAAVYFFVCALVILACIVTFFLVMRMSFTKYYLNKASSKNEPGVNRNESVNTEHDEISTLVPKQDVVMTTKKPSVFSVFKKIWVQAVMVMTVFWITLSVFPGLSVSVPTWYKGTEMKDWLPILVGTTFNIFDFIGRTAPRWMILFNRKVVPIPVLIRILILPLFIFMYKPSIVGLEAFNDAVPLLAIAFVALSNGYLSSLCMMYGPSLVDDHEKEVAGTLMTFFLLVGICLGSFTGLAIGQILGAILPNNNNYVD
ncbi:hypothetical protein FDP41_003493 [Naegleria fowleri]|uniref:Equilibrative nucleoside transporter n=1 Tax=Naegleria fowleri TaxID=5763 RepID=A0A6A5BT25_NAEFO|nr:uncharacterized protein FDP41_003493 [Naegleria fowleri]KAF0977501.1 hypothetical protein FDP41_003493 [Naegleria fowleri]CAG4711157.1 unnamed protein product [Naegleria fowleri]